MQRPMARPSFSNFLRARSRCSQATPSTTAHFRTALSGTSFCRSVTSSYSPNFSKPPRWRSRAASSLDMPRHGQSFERAISGHLSWALLCRNRCRLLLAEVPKGTDRNSELKLRLRMWETGQVSELISKFLGQQHSGPLRRKKRGMQPQTDEQRGKRACALTAWGSISKAMKGLVGRASQGSADCRRSWTNSDQHTELGQWHSSHHCGECRGDEDRLVWWKVQGSVERNGGAKPQQNRYRVAPARQIGAHE